MVLLCLEREFLVSVLCYSLIMLKNDSTLLSAFILLSLLADVCSVSYSVGVVKSSFSQLPSFPVPYQVEFLHLICSGVGKEIVKSLRYIDETICIK